MSALTSSASNQDPASASVNLSFSLSLPFQEIRSVNLTDMIDVYSQERFQVLIQEREKNGLPYFLALTEDEHHNVQLVDGATFMRAFFKYGQVDSPTNRLPIQTARIYKINQIRDKIFEFVCNLENLRDHKDHFAKFVNACDLNLNPNFRSKEQFYMVTVFEQGFPNEKDQSIVERNLDQAFFWLNKSAAEGYFGAHVVLADWYEKGNEKVEPSEKLVLEHMQEAVNKVPKNHSLTQKIYQRFAELSTQKKY